MFIEILEKTLKARGITMNKLAKETGIGQSTTDRWKKGSLPSIDKIIKICEYLDVSADYLLGIKPQELSDDEMRLIHYFRQLDERGKEIILDFATREAEKLTKLS